MKVFALIVANILCLTILNGAEQAPKTLTPGENLVLDGVPSIPAELVEQIGRYTEFRAATVFDWHPTKPEMVISTRFGDVAQVHRIAKPG